MTASNGFPWADTYLLGYAPMDDTHKEFVTIVHAMLTAPDDDFAAHLDEFHRHAQSHFEQERGWMSETGFPAMDCHVDEHEAVLKSVCQVQELLARHDDGRSNAEKVAIGRSLAAELARWFPGHADYMDSALAQWMVKRRTGGAPVVLRRGLEDMLAEPQPDR